MYNNESHSQCYQLILQTLLQNEAGKVMLRVLATFKPVLQQIRLEQNLSTLRVLTAQGKLIVQQVT